MSNLFNTILYEPLLNALIFIYNIFPIKDMGIAIIILTILLRVILWPLSKQTIEVQKKMKAIQPLLEEINKKYKDDPQKRAQELMRIYRENKANPATSCLPLLIQLPILWAVFKVFRNGLKPEALAGLYSFVAKPLAISPFFLGIDYFDLSKPNIFLAIATAAAQFWQGKMMSTASPMVQGTASKDEGFQAIINKQMLYLMPILTLIFGLQLPSGLMLYWLVSTLLMILQQWWQFRNKNTVAPVLADTAITSLPSGENNKKG